MKAKDTVMSDKQIVSLLSQHCYPPPKHWDELDLTRKAQAEISFKAVREELKKQIEGVKANAFSVSLFGDSNHQLKMDAMVSAYDVVLNKIKEMEDERTKT